MSNKERLENIVALGVDGQGNVLIKGEDFHWLMELAEKAEILREALEFYADENNYVVDISEVEFLEDIPYAKPPIVYERGIKARKALEVNENE